MCIRDRDTAVDDEQLAFSLYRTFSILDLYRYMTVQNMRSLRIQAEFRQDLLADILSVDQFIIRNGVFLMCCLLYTSTDDIVSEYGISRADARDMIYTNGLKIYTTMDSDIQNIVEDEFAKDSNYSGIRSVRKDKNNNILTKNGTLMLRPYSYYINDKGEFTLSSDEYKKNADGSLTIYAKKRLDIYDCLLYTSFCQYPFAAGKGGLRRGIPLSPSKDAIRAVSSPHTNAPAPALIRRSKSNPLSKMFLPRKPFSLA